MTTFDVGDMHPNTPHLLADLVELLCIINYTGRDTFHQTDLASLLNVSNTSVDEVDQERREVRRISSDAVLGDRTEAQLENVWIQLSYRFASLNDMYPFIVEGDEIRMREEQTNKHRVYIFTLCCSRLRSFIRIRVRRNAGQEGLLFYVNMQHKHFYQLMGMSKFLTLTQRIAVRITVQIYAELYALWVVI